MRIYKEVDFAEWAEEEELTDGVLTKSIKEIEQGLVDASLGAGLYKKRIARKGQGKSGGYRTLIAFKQDDRAIFVYGFSKRDQENISHRDNEKFKEISRYYLSASNEELSMLVKNKVLMEIM